jgi:hypothetical protein
MRKISNRKKKYIGVSLIIVQIILVIIIYLASKDKWLFTFLLISSLTLLWPVLLWINTMRLGIKRATSFYTFYYTFIILCSVNICSLIILAHYLITVTPRYWTFLVFFFPIWWFIVFLLSLLLWFCLTKTTKSKTSPTFMG